MRRVCPLRGSCARGASAAAVMLVVVAPLGAASPADLSRAAATYTRLCARCHGEDGRGVASRSRTALPDFTSAAWQRSRTDAQLLANVLNGMGADMPAFDDRLSREEAREQVAYVRRFGPQQVAVIPAGLAGDDSFDARFRALLREFESLARQVRALNGRGDD